MQHLRPAREKNDRYEYFFLLKKSLILHKILCARADSRALEKETGETDMAKAAVKKAAKKAPARKAAKTTARKTARKTTRKPAARRATKR